MTDVTIKNNPESGCAEFWANNHNAKARMNFDFAQVSTNIPLGRKYEYASMLLKSGLSVSEECGAEKL